MNLTKLFVNPNRWIKNGYAQYKDGTRYSFTRPYNEKHAEPYKFSLYGAMCYFTDADSGARQKVAARLSKAIERYTGKNMFIAEFNDNPDTTFEDLSQVIKIYNTIK